MKFYLVKADTWDIGVKGLGRCPVYFQPPLGCIVDLDIYDCHPRIEWNSSGGAITGDAFVRLFGGYDSDIAIDVWRKMMSTFKRCDGDLRKLLDKFDRACYSDKWRNHNEFFLENHLTKKGKGYHEWYLEIDVSGDIDKPTYTLTEHTLKNVHYFVYGDSFTRNKVTADEVPKYNVPVSYDAPTNRFTRVGNQRKYSSRDLEWRYTRSE